MKTHRPEVAIATDMARDPSTFPPLAAFPHIAHEQLNNWIEALRVVPVSAIEWEWPSSWTVGPRTIRDSMWFIVLSGTVEGWVQEPHRVRKLKAGDMLLIPAKAPHMLRATGDSKPHLIAVHFYSTVLGGINLLELLGFPSFLEDNESLRLVATSMRLAHEFAVKAPGWKQSMGAEIFQMLLRILRAAPESFQPANNHHGHPDLLRVFPAVEWIYENLGRSEIDVEQIAATVFLSPTHFRRIFHEVFGMSPIRFVRKCRMERAGILIRTTDMSLKEIAHNCGFVDTTYFSKTFRKLMKMTPHEYRHESIVEEMQEMSPADSKVAALPDQILQFMRDRIISGRWSPGHRIVETRIAKELSVGQAAVQEALGKLEETGLVVRAQGSTFKVMRMTREQYSQRFRVRTELEGLAVELAAENCSDTGRVDLMAALSKMKAAAAANSVEEYYRADLELHEAIWRLPGNPDLEKALSQLVVPLFAFAMIKMVGHPDVDLMANAREHEELVRAILSSNKLEARRTTERLLAGFGRDGCSLIEDGSTHLPHKAEELPAKRKTRGAAKVERFAVN